MEDMKKLVEEAHGRGIKIILEFAPNYVSIDHPFVNEADKAAWFKENKRKTSPATEWLDEVAVFDTENDEVIDYLIDVGEYWLKETGVDGRSEEHTSELQSRGHLVCRLLLEKKKKT